MQLKSKVHITIQVYTFPFQFRRILSFRGFCPEFVHIPFYYSPIVSHLTDIIFDENYLKSVHICDPVELGLVFGFYKQAIFGSDQLLMSILTHSTPKHRESMAFFFSKFFSSRLKTVSTENINVP
jgi:hypothetical protein